MGAGFIRRFSTNPGNAELGRIEGVAIIDNPPPGSIQGVGTGCVCVVGECSDASYAVTVAANGDVSAKVQPVRVYSPADIVDKVGGWDETLGNFGTGLGNLYASLANKRFPVLVLVPIDNVTPAAGTNKGVRVFRDLPTNASAVSATPAVPMAPAVVSAGREFRSGSNRVRTAAKVLFTDTAAYWQGVDGVLAAGASAVIQPFTSATGDFVNKGVQVGDILVVGVIGTNNVLNAKTFRVQLVTNATTLQVERLDGAAFVTVVETALAYRLHAAATADSAGMASLHVAAATASGYRIPARPLDATITAGSALTPTVVPDAPTATSWDTLSGLGARVEAATALTYSAAVHAPNAANSATLDARYATAIQATANDDDPSNLINIIVAARKSATIRSTLKQHCATTSALGNTRTTCFSPELSVVAVNVATGTGSTGAGAQRLDRCDYSWPNCTTFVPEAVNLSITKADGTTTTDGYLDDGADVWLASVLANTNPEENPGQVGSPYSDLLAGIAGFQTNLTTKLGMAEYIALKAAGVCALRRDREDGFLFQSGVTTDLTSGREPISRRRMADFLQDSMARRTNKFAKGKATTTRKDGIRTEIETFLADLVSENNPAAARIAGYSVDDKSGNTPSTVAAGLHFIIVRVQLLGELNTIILQTEISANAIITSQL